MATTITPGWNFGPNDRPTRETLLQQALGLTITNIPEGQLTSPLIRVIINDSTSPSNLPLDGSMWVDARGSLWGRNKFGNVKIRRYEGGLETNRIQSLGDGGGGAAIGLPGLACVITSRVASSTNITDARLHTSQGNGYDLSTLQPGISQETTTSNPNVYFRHALLGYSRMRSADFAPGFSARRMRLYMRSAFSTSWVGEDHDVGTPANSAQGEAVARHADTTNAEVSGLFFGLPVRRA